MHLSKLARGAIHGLIAWLAYETGERAPSRWDWRMIGILFIAYPILGSLPGALSAALLAALAAVALAGALRQSFVPATRGATTGLKSQFVLNKA